MIFKSKKTLNNFLYNLPTIGSGSQGQCYLDKENSNVIKIFHSYFYENEDYNNIDNHSQDILKFINIQNGTYSFPHELVMLKKNKIGYITKYTKGLDLYGINPFIINLNTFTSDIQTAYKDICKLSQDKIVSFDVLYNILYGINGFKIIDTADYEFTDEMEYKELYELNRNYFDIAIKLFLVNNFFNNFVNSQKELKEMYKEANALDFLKYFRQKLSEQTGNEILYLKEAKDLVKYNKNTSYIRTLIL